MRSRRLNNEDVPKIEAIYRRDHNHEFDVTRLRQCLDDRIIEDDKGEIVAYGILKPFVEAVVVTDLTYPEWIRAKAIKMLMDVAVRSMERSDISDLHIFSRTPEFAEFMKKHFGFTGIIGEGLVLDVERYRG